ncbi:MAG: acylhydrolase [Clostridiales bacterium]|nr:acylhydrolase [Candidatus Crickella equi]
MKYVLCYGDSNTYGYNPNIGRRSRYEKSKRWPNILQNLLGDEFEVYPEGLNGRTTAYDRPGFCWKNGLQPLPAILGSHKPLDYVIFMLGTNDCNVEMGLSSQQIADGMEQLILTTREMGLIQQERIPQIVVISPAPILEDYEASPFNGEIDLSSVRKSRELADLYKKLCSKYECLFVNAEASNIEVSPLDCEHLTENGHKKLAEIVYKTIIDNERN